MKTIDLHAHTCQSHDGAGTVADWCELAVERGVSVIGFCEHLDLDETDVYFNQLDYDAYRAEVAEARGRFADRIQIRMGVEIGYLPRLEKEIGEWLELHPVDFAMGSVHTIFENAGISGEYDALETFARYEFWEIYEEFFGQTLSLVKSGLFDVVGHFDLVQRYGAHYLKGEMEWGRLYGLIGRAFEGMILRQMALEINTSGLRQQPKACYPDPKLLAFYRELGGEQVTLGSDAHDPTLVAAGMDRAAELVRAHGLRPVEFIERQPRGLSG